ncbi:TetR/AcrR family transcriptional regulator [Hydrogenovibrio sp. JE_KL2]|uniref:TetR/AcrR family transcriptional regulator n=1 Tax=Hydrogenovibrio sp. JE_KL2 TaxID=2651188 RepID=UPI00128CBB90|nr:TetR/AcrR family transcriptional regulator [Hydrogenovibrio sp. JE_KL2]MPQ77365.1 TetR/AcrR family transcriptional regulator [Hydrogenovibrio sp. JE_KL2]
MSSYDRILMCATELFSKEGYEAVSMREIAKSAGLHTVSSVYNHFKDKQSLYEATLKSVCDHHNSEVCSVLCGDERAEDKLKKMIALNIKRMADNMTFRRLILRELVQNDPDKLKFLAEKALSESCRQLEAVLADINPNADHHYVITSLLGLILFHLQVAGMRDYLPAVEQKHHNIDYLAEKIFATTMANLAI